MDTPPLLYYTLHHSPTTPFSSSLFSGSVGPSPPRGPTGNPKGSRKTNQLLALRRFGLAPTPGTASPSGRKGRQGEALRKKLSYSLSASFLWFGPPCPPRGCPAVLTNRAKGLSYSLSAPFCSEDKPSEQNLPDPKPAGTHGRSGRLKNKYSRHKNHSATLPVIHSSPPA